MKRSMVLVLTAAVISMFSVSALAAEGVQERREGETRWETRAPAQSPYYSSERVSVDGTVELSAAGVELKASDGEKYSLMYPRFLAEGVEVEDGDSLSVEGYLVPGPRWETDDDEDHLRVERVTLNGEEYDLASSYGPRGGHSSRGGHGPKSGGARGPGM
ncbi:MAG: hypothetical protein ACLFQW_10810, partial [Spirochaetaceae bacterium]